MLYRIGTEKELPPMEEKLPEQVYTDLYTSVIVLDSEYGADRNYLETGGYSLVVETADDLADFKAIIDYENHPAEWVVRECRGCGFLSALFITSNDFGIMVFMPIAIAPDAILRDMED